VSQSASDDPTGQSKSVAGAQLNAGRRSLVKSGLALSIMALWKIEPSEAQEKNMAENKKDGSLTTVLTYNDVRSVSPALERYTRGPLLEGVWKRNGLSPRDRSVVTVAALIARIQTIEMPYHFALAFRQRRKTRRAVGDHHAPRLLRRVAKCHVRCCGREGHLPSTRYWLGPATAGKGEAFAAEGGSREAKGYAGRKQLRLCVTGPGAEHD
jgi:hypothetical protein